MHGQKNIKQAFVDAYSSNM